MKKLFALAITLFAVVAQAQIMWQIDCRVGPQFIGAYQFGIYPTFAAACEAQRNSISPPPHAQVVNEQHCVLVTLDYIRYVPIQDVCRGDPHFRAGPTQRK